MKYGPIEITDRFGRTVVLRSAEVSDCEILVKYLKDTASETRFLLREPDESEIPIEREREFIQWNIDFPKDLMLLAFLDGQHVGNCSVSGKGSMRRFSHRCEIGIALYQRYCGCGIGSAMLETVLQVAKSMGYEQAELEVVADNRAAISMYEKHGFVKCGQTPNNMKYADGSYADAIQMVKVLTYGN